MNIVSNERWAVAPSCSWRLCALIISWVFWSPRCLLPFSWADGLPEFLFNWRLCCYDFRTNLNSFPLGMLLGYSVKIMAISYFRYVFTKSPHSEFLDSTKLYRRYDWAFGHAGWCMISETGYQYLSKSYLWSIHQLFLPKKWVIIINHETHNACFSKRELKSIAAEQPWWGRPW